MNRSLSTLIALFCFCLAAPTRGEEVVDIPTRPGVSQRLLVAKAAVPRATVILLAGGHGGLGIFANGSLKWGDGNFLIRSRPYFLEQGLTTIVVDAPSDRPNLAGFRQTPEHLADIKAVIAWARQQDKHPVWLVGTSRGTQSAAFVATQAHAPEGPDGLVLTSTILTDNKGRPVPAMPLEQLSVPTLVVHHEEDGCSHCRYADIGSLSSKLTHLPHQQLLTIRGGTSRGDPCEAYAYHGFNGLEREVVAQIADWILAPSR
ncbi:MAG: alpha/beta hydrolase [Betaproteobacteria bacterium]|nr:alpha/beta hydrolase [Betaproteobacteria bacterium]